MPWNGAGGQNIEHTHMLLILSSVFFVCFFLAYSCNLVLLARRSSGELHCPATALIYINTLQDLKSRNYLKDFLLNFICINTELQK